MKPLRRLFLAASALLVSLVWLRSSFAADPPARLALRKGNHVVFIGNSLAERMNHFGNFETLLHSRFPDLELTVRNLGWSADELTLRPRSQGYNDHGDTLKGLGADVVIAFFGFNESFAGPEGLKKFETDLEQFITETTTTKYNDKTPPLLALVTPIANENIGRPGVPDGAANNKNIKLYAEAMKRVAARKNIPCADLFTPTLALMSQPGAKKLTFNGVHLTEYGDSQVAPLLDQALFGSAAPKDTSLLEKVRSEVLEKNRQWWYDYRAVNGCYIYGSRKAPFGVVNFPDEFKKLRKMTAKRDQRIWTVAQGKTVSETIDDSDTGELKQIQTNFKGKIELLAAEEAAKRFKLAPGFEIKLFASEEDFPDLKKPCQFGFDGRGRVWVCTMGSYPMYVPGKPVNDKVLILEDTDGDGKADKCTVFADKLYLPTGMLVGDGGCYVAQQPNLVFLKDTKGVDKADQREIILSGFDSADSHHAINAFRWGPGGDMLFMEGTFHHTQVETPYGPRHVKNAGVFRYEPRTEKLDIFVSYGFANPWGVCFDRWGQTFLADASGGANYFATAFSGDIDYPNKRPGMKQFLKMQWRPTSGCELVSSRHFPESWQGHYLLNNTIGFLGTLHYGMKEEGSGFAADPLEPLLRSEDPNCRPVDLRFGPDGALYIVDWYNPLIGHMQHSVRDPNRDKTHGRICGVTAKGRPLLPKPKIVGATIPELLELLKSYEDITRELARLELRLHETGKVTAELEKWLAGLDKKDKEYEHHQLEALWVCQHHDAVNEALLKKVLTSPDYRARAAATRVLCYWRDRVKDPLELLRTQVNDQHPRVRLEAVRALSFFNSAKAQDVALESLVHPQDYYLEYTLKETLNTLDKRLKPKK